MVGLRRLTAAVVNPVPTEDAVFGSWTVKENVDIWSRPITVLRSAAPRSTACAGCVSVIAERSAEKAASLSGGPQRMVALSRALLHRPEILFIDELSAGLAPGVVGDLLGALGRLQTEGVTIVVAEQSVNVAVAAADRAIFLERGRVRFDGPTGDLLERDDMLRAAFLSG